MLRTLQGRLARGDWGILDNDCKWDEIHDQYVRVVKQSHRDKRNVLRDLARFPKFRPVSSIKQLNHAYIVAYREWRLAQRIGKAPKAGEKETRPFVTARTGINPSSGENEVASDGPSETRNDDPSRQTTVPSSLIDYSEISTPEGTAVPSPTAIKLSFGRV